MLNARGSAARARGAIQEVRAGARNSGGMDPAALGRSPALPYNHWMKILLNGQDFEVPEGITIATLVNLRRQSGHLRTPAYAVERNKDVVVRSQHEAVRLEAGDKVEIVVMVGGG